MQVKAELTEWQTVQHIPWPNSQLPMDAAEKLLATAGMDENSFELWPRMARYAVICSMNEGVKLGHVDKDWKQSEIAGRTTDLGERLELRATWKPAA